MNVILGFVFGVLGFCAWITHVVYCLSNAIWIALLAGAICFPIGIVHGIMIWFGAGI